LQSRKNLLQLRLQPDKLDRMNGFLGMQNNIQRQAERREAPSHCGPHPASYSVSFHRATQNFAHREAYARTLIIAPAPIKGRYVPRKIFSAFFVHSLKIRMSQQSRASEELLSMLFLAMVHIVACIQWRENLQAGYSRNPGLTETRLRPLARRRDRTACPLFVFIRVRKPCVLERWRRLGWNVRFGIELWNSLLRNLCTGQPRSIKEFWHAGL